ncbi:MAG TPA: DUF6064 family protein, partial [Bacteroidota bacterium]
MELITVGIEESSIHNEGKELTMKIPFSPEQFFEVFAFYNESVWPLQIVFNVAALVVLYFVFRSHALSGKIVTLVLAFLWLWMGIVY